MKDTAATSSSSWEEPSAERIANWKKDHGIDTIHLLKAKDKDGSIKKAYLREPTIADLSRAAASEKAKAGTYNQSLYENCVLDQHPSIKNSNSLYLGMVGNMDKIVVSAEIEVEKL